jgi:hypothetical protein
MTPMQQLQKLEPAADRPMSQQQQRQQLTRS